jgi:hypothetical protein
LYFALEIFPTPTTSTPMEHRSFKSSIIFALARAPVGRSSTKDHK